MKMKNILSRYLLGCCFFLLSFSGWTQYVINGTAASMGSDCFRLTQQITSQAGSVWFQNKITLNADLRVEGTLNFGIIDGNGADGMAFVLQPVCSGLGSLGGGLGYQNISPSLAVEFDTWQNTDQNDPAADHIALMKNGNVNHGTANNLQGPISLSNLENGANHPFIVQWDAAATNLKVWLDGILRINYTGNIVTTIFGGNKNVFWGFTGATGAAVNNQTVCITSKVFTEDGSFTVTKPSCPDYHNGAIDLNPAGGIAPFTYAWSNGKTTEDVSGLAAGTFSVVVTDGNGCHSSYTINVTNEVDAEPPVISCPGNITVNNDPGQCGARVYYNVTSSDNCPVTSLPGFTFIGTMGSSSYFVSNDKFTYLDALNHSRAHGLHMATISSAAENDFVVSGLFSSGLISGNPWIGLSDAVTEGAFRWITGEPYAYTNWGPGEPNNAGNEDYANYLFNGFTSKWNDLPNSLPPSWTPNPYVLELESTPIYLQEGIYSGEVFPTGSTTVTYQAVDAAGNTASCSFTVTVTDNEPPVAACQAVLAELGTDGTATITPAQVDIGSSDACGIATMTLSKEVFDCSNLGENTVVFTVTDNNGNSSTCQASVNVVDNIDPVAVCKNFSVTLAGGSASVGPMDIDNGSYDNCSIASYSLSRSTFSCSDIGDVPVTLTVTDPSGHSASCTATVTVVGVIPSCSIDAVPGSGAFTGGPATTVYLGYGPQSVTLQSSVIGGNGFTYAWSGLSTGMLSCTDCASPVFTPASEGKYEFLLTATNANGCFTTCTITICVFDVRVPGTSGKKVYLCHLPPGNPGNPQLLSISVNAVPAHIPGHVGDHLGTCDQSCDLLQTKSGDVSGELIVSEGVNFDLVVHPNPFRNEITLTMESENSAPATMTVYDLTGKLLGKEESISPNVPLTFGSELNSGMYLVFVKQGDQVQKIKIVKTK
jgi:hypothetical protein